MPKLEVVYAQEPLPTEVTKTIFLAGPTPRNASAQGWRQEAVSLLEELGFDGHVFVPESEDKQWNGKYVEQIEWEEAALNMADTIVFWVPRDPAGGMPAFTTNIEWGMWYDSGKVVWGAPDGAAHVRYPEYYAKKFKVPTATTLKETLKLAVDKVGAGSPRKGGECTVPLYLWQRQEFQGWYTELLVAGNTLNSVRVVSTFPQTPKPFLMTLHVNVHIGSEGRDKVNEVVIQRSDISSVLLYSRDGLQPQDIKVVLVREFRSPVRNGEGFVYELPGGSTKKDSVSPLQVALDEVQEEVGIKLDPSRVQFHDRRQLVATLSSHYGHLYSYALTPKELAAVMKEMGKAHGVEGDSERTYVEIRTLKQVMDDGLVDWVTLGMILACLR